jgi:uncharacterized phage protein gp47/JayE
MSFGVTPTGFIPKTLADCKADLEDAFRGEFGQGINLTPPSRFATLIGIFAERLAEVWDLAAAIYSSFDPDQAVGDALEARCLLTGTLRAEARSSVVKGVVLSGTPGTSIPSGRVLSVQGSPDSRFLSSVDATIGDGGAVAVDFVAERTGPVVALAGTLTVIETPVAGLTSATNPTDAILGSDVETDAALRTRRRFELRSLGNAALDAIRGDVLQVAGVASCAVFENDTEVEDADGMPPHSVEVVVSGGDDDEIAAAIFGSVAGGVGTHGTTSVGVTDSEGVDHTIKFTRPVAVPIYLVIAIEKDPNAFPVDGVTQIRDALLAFGVATYAGGVDVAAARLYGPISKVAGVLDVPVLNIGTAPAPATGARVAIGSREFAVLDSSRIAITPTNGTP